VGRPALLVNATELLRRAGLTRRIETAVGLADVDVVDDRLAGDIAVDVILTSTVDDIDVAGRLRVDWSDTCRRCLRPLADTLVIEVHERYAEADDTGMRRADPEAFPIEHGQLDLAPMVREEVLLGVPDAPLCRPDCPGLCPICGEDLQTGTCQCTTEVRDERWAALDALRLEE
jgi:uncharacterized protein